MVFRVLFFCGKHSFAVFNFARSEVQFNVVGSGGYIFRLLLRSPFAVFTPGGLVLSCRRGGYFVLAFYRSVTLVNAIS